VIELSRAIPEEPIPGKRLGRHVEHDARSRAYGIVRAPSQLVSKRHRRYGGPFNQGELGSCTGNAAAGAINTVGVHVTGRKLLREVEAVDLYSLATTLDEFSGSYPPDDTGSSGLAAAKAAKQRGFIKEYRHAFGIEQALEALMLGPVITGVDWYEGFDHPGERGLVEIAGQMRGGHEFEVIGLELRTPLDESVVECVNSWGTAWGERGRFRMTVSTWRRLLEADGDVTVLA
jgi:hypothetical protein